MKGILLTLFLSFAGIGLVGCPGWFGGGGDTQPGDDLTSAKAEVVQIASEAITIADAKAQQAVKNVGQAGPGGQHGTPEALKAAQDKSNKVKVQVEEIKAKAIEAKSEAEAAKTQEEVNKAKEKAEAAKAEAEKIEA